MIAPCQDCGHRHEGPGLAGICVGCPCEYRAAETVRPGTELDDASYERMRDLIAGDEDLRIAVSEVWWAAYRAGIRDGIDAAHQQRADVRWKSTAVCPFDRRYVDRRRIAGAPPVDVFHHDLDPDRA